MTSADFVTLNRSVVAPSPWNPRTVMDDAELEALAADIAANGIEVPLIVRAKGDGTYEIGAGHRRYRASARANVHELPCIVREFTDAEFLSFLWRNNDQAEDVHPLDEAAHYERMRKELGDLRLVAQSVKRGFLHVYNRHRLLNLIGPFAAAFRAQALTLGHVIVLARLTTEQQQEVMDDEREGVFTYDASHGSLFDHDENEDTERPFWHGKKARSVGELQTYIDKNIRFDVDADETAAVLFPETVAAIEAIDAKARKRGVISISELHQVPPSAKDPKKRTYSVVSWRRADGKHDSEECEYSKLGVVVAGPGRGHSFAVCVDREHCMTHFGESIKARKKAAKEKAKGASAEPRKAEDKGKPDWQIEQERREAERLKGQERERKWAVVFEKIATELTAGVTLKPFSAAMVELALMPNLMRLDWDDGYVFEQLALSPLTVNFSVTREEWEALDVSDDDVMLVFWRKRVAQFATIFAENLGEMTARASIVFEKLVGLDTGDLDGGRADLLAEAVGVDLAGHYASVTDEQVAVYEAARREERLLAQQERAPHDDDEDVEELWDETGEVEDEDAGSQSQEGEHADDE